MCGRFTFEHEWPAFLDLYHLPAEERGRNTQARFNIAPTQDVLIVHNDADGHQKAESARWWLVPFWAKELPKGAMLMLGLKRSGRLQPSATPSSRSGVSFRRTGFMNEPSIKTTARRIQG